MNNNCRIFSYSPEMVKELGNRTPIGWIRLNTCSYNEALGKIDLAWSWFFKRSPEKA